MAMVSEVLLSAPCVETMAAAGATKVARRKRGSQQKILESADLTTLLNSSLSQASIAKKLGVSASALSKYLKKHPLELEGEGVEGEGVEGEGGEKPWGSLEDKYLRKTTIFPCFMMLVSSQKGEKVLKKEKRGGEIEKKGGGEWKSRKERRA